MKFGTNNCDGCCKHGSTEKKRKRMAIGELADSPLPCSFRYSTDPKIDNQEKSLYICFFSCVPYVSFDWYVINPGEFTNNKEITTLNPTFAIDESVVGRVCDPVALGSTIYFIFRDKMKGSTSSNVVKFETRKISGGDDPFICQNLNSRSLVERNQTLVVSAHGKIYLFGSDISSPTPWAEVFDPDLNVWSPLPDPPNKLLESSVRSSVTAVVGHKIFLRLCAVENNLFSFDVKSKLWEQVTTPLSILRYWSSSNAVLDDILFSYKSGSVRAYDLTNETWFKKPVIGLSIKSTFDDDLGFGYVVAIANKMLCVVWMDNVDSRQCVHCLKFRFARAVNSKGQSFLRADVQGRSTFHITTGTTIDYCLAL